MNQLLRAIAMVVLLFIATPETRAQMDPAKWQVGVNGGIFVYQGDLSPTDVGSYKTAKPSFGIYISKVLNPSLLLRTNLAVGKLYGNDAKYSDPVWRQQRNYKFTS